jgi:hypothetical protein
MEKRLKHTKIRYAAAYELEYIYRNGVVLPKKLTSYPHFYLVLFSGLKFNGSRLTDENCTVLKY